MQSLFGADAQESPTDLAAALAPPAAPGHFDELRGRVSPVADGVDAARAAATPLPPCAPWSHFFDKLGPEGFADLDHRTVNLTRQIRDNGVTYNVYADANGPQRPWSLDLFPLIITPASWQRIEAGVLQRAELLERIMADVYGPQQLLAANLLPPALVQGHPGYLRPMHGVRPAGGRHLHIVDFDLARDPAGNWSVLSQRTEAPSGLGYLLENRLIVSRL
ncbi:MAG TPA: circularly permuted type 2 ATP-grasp protein, partial [Ramlibacter sp.]|nr:circularly permuted type 2 ATP-grasp protein [Ramlibacter sp.]